MSAIDVEWCVAEAVDVQAYTSKIDATECLANLFRLPMVSVNVLRQVGRFFLVEYAPYNGDDPDIILSIGASSFNHAVKNFQEMRLHHSRRTNTHGWYDECEELALKVMAQLGRMIPTEAEFDFVSAWLKRCYMTAGKEM